MFLQTIDDYNGKLPNNQQQHSHYQQHLHYQQHGSMTTWPSYNSKPTSNFFITSSSDFVGKPITTNAAIVSSSIGNLETESRPTIDVLTTMVLETSSSSTAILNTKLPLPLTTAVSSTTHVLSSNSQSTLRPVQFVNSFVIATTGSSVITSTSSNNMATSTENPTTCSDSTVGLPEHLLSTLESNEIADNSVKMPGGNVIKTVSAARTGNNLETT